MMGSKIIQMAAALLVGAMVNRKLGTSLRGVLAEMQTWVYLVVMVCSLSMDSAIYHIANKSRYGTDDKSRFVTILWLSVFCSALSVLMLFFIAIFRPNLFSSATHSYLPFLYLWMISTLLASNLIVFVQAVGNIKLSAIIGGTQTVIQLLIITLGYFFGIINLFYVIISWFILQIVALIFIFIMAWKFGLFDGYFSKDLAIGIIKAGLKLHIGVISTFIYMKANQLIVFNYCGEHEAGIFAVALNLCIALIFIPSTFQLVLYPRVIHATDDYEITVRSMRIGFYVWGLMILLLLLFAKPICLMYAGRAFLPSVNIFRILMIAGWLLPISSLLAPYFVKLGAFKMASVSAVLLGLASIWLNLYLVPKYAAFGAGLATSLTSVIGFGFSLAFLWYLSKKSPFVIFIPRLVMNARP